MRRAAPSGFSFVEVMAAVLILSISLIVLMNNQAKSMDMLGRARTADYATTLAVAKMTDLVTFAKLKGFTVLRDEETGEFDQEKYPTYRWRYWKTTVPPPDFELLMAGAAGGDQGGQKSGDAGLLGGPLQAIGKVWGNALQELHVEVTWGEGNSQRSYELATQLIASDAVMQLANALSALTSQGAQGTQGTQ